MRGKGHWESEYALNWFIFIPSKMTSSPSIVLVSHYIAYVALKVDLCPSFGFMQINTLVFTPVFESLVQNIVYKIISPNDFDDVNTVSYEVNTIRTSDSV